MSPSTPLRVEALEARDVPATFGTPWPDGQNLTLSFAPDGTPIAGTASDLAAAFGALDPQAKLAVLRAFQAWAVHANVNIGLVPDAGAAFGTGGAVQGDPRFGDVRVGGRPLSPDVLAVTAPYNLYDNYSGDIVLNTAQDFGSPAAQPGAPRSPGAESRPEPYDLYTALLQESGHALGVGNSPDVSSAMYEYYLGARAGLSAADVTAIQALYGARQADKYEGARGNGTLATATRYPALTGPVTADLTTRGDADVYKFTAGLLTSRVTVSLRAAGLSLLTARVELLDSKGRVLASGTAADPLSNDVTLSLGSVRAWQTYYVRVTGARADEFAIGSYELDVKQSSLLTGLTDLVGNLLDETGLNDTLYTATRLLTGAAAVGPQTEYGTDGSFGSSRDTDVYRITVPPAAGGGRVNMLVTVWGDDGRALNPWMEVTDAFGRKLNAEVISADGNTTTLQVQGLKPGAAYFVRALSDSKSVGGYHLAADLRAEVEEVPEVASGTLGRGATASGSFDLTQSGQVHLVLSATGAGGAAEAVVADATGREVGRFSTNAGRGRSLDLFLNAGTYSVTVRSVSGSPIGFELGAAIVTDPVGARPEDPTNAPQPTAPPPAPEQPVNTQPAPPPPPPGDGAQPPTDEPQPEPPPAPPTEPTEEEQATPPPAPPPQPTDEDASEPAAPAMPPEEDEDEEPV